MVLDGQDDGVGRGDKGAPVDGLHHSLGNRKGNVKEQKGWSISETVSKSSIINTASLTAKIIQVFIIE